MIDMGVVFDLLVEADVLPLSPPRIPGNTRCPFHDDRQASCYVWVDHWRCFVCDVGGGPLELVIRAFEGEPTDSRQRATAKRFLENGLGGEEIEWGAFHFTRPEPDPVDFTDRFRREAAVAWTREAVAYVQETWPHLPWRTLQSWGIACNDYYLMIPHFDTRGRIVGVKTRTYTGGNKGAKRSFAGSTYPRLYTVGLTTPRGVDAWLVEGESDTWTMTLAHPRDQVFGLPAGAMTWRAEFLNQLMPYQTVWVALDNDEAGDRAADKIVGILKDAGHTSVFRIKPAGYKDWCEQAVAELRVPA